MHVKLESKLLGVKDDGLVDILHYVSYGDIRHRFFQDPGSAV